MKSLPGGVCWGAGAALGAVLLTACPSVPSRPSSPAGAPDPSTLEIQRVDRRFNTLVPFGAKFEVVAEGFEWLEGPTWVPSDGHLLFSDIPRNRIIAWHPATGTRVFRHNSGYSGEAPFTGREPGSNGMTLDRAGRLLICQHGDRRLVRLEPDGRLTIIASHYAGKRLNSPNDVIVASSGAIFFTDPPFGLPGAFDDPARELEVSGVYRVVEGQPVQRVIDRLKAPNGLALSPNERTLYVSDVDPAAPAWWAFDVDDDGTVGEGRRLVDAKPFMKGRRGGPDGIEVDHQGFVFAAGPEGVYVFAPDGLHLGTMFTGVPTANLEWGEDGRTLFVTANRRVLRIRLTTHGAVRLGPDAR